MRLEKKDWKETKEKATKIFHNECTVATALHETRKIINPGWKQVLRIVGDFDRIWGAILIGIWHRIIKILAFTRRKGRKGTKSVQTNDFTSRSFIWISTSLRMCVWKKARREIKKEKKSNRWRYWLNTRLSYNRVDGIKTGSNLTNKSIGGREVFTSPLWKRSIIMETMRFLWWVHMIGNIQDRQWTWCFTVFQL